MDLRDLSVNAGSLTDILVQNHNTPPSASRPSARYESPARTEKKRPTRLKCRDG